MQFILAHWHCILPAAAIIIALLFMSRGGKGEQTRNPPAVPGAREAQNREEP